MTARRRRVLVMSTSFPSCVEPTQGVFVKERVKFTAAVPGTEVRVVSPIPYFPPIRRFARWYPLSQIPAHETVDGLEVVRPRYFLPPKIGGYVSPRLMYLPVRAAVDRLRHDFDFDVIDAHFIYPTGVLAVALGARYNRPVVITCRGEDIECFPDLPVVGRQIRGALRGATQLVAVSARIAETMRRHGADSGRITVIPNGVDAVKFSPIARGEARRALELPGNRPMILAVGHRLELKGFHILVDALPRIRERFPDVLVAIVGGPVRWAADYRPIIEQRVRLHGLEAHVRLAGERPHAELYQWYSAADVLAILSSREGSPNVLMEALACGLPAVATPVGGIPDVLATPGLGMLLPERSAEAAAAGLLQALSHPWDRQAIRRAAEATSWHETARRMTGVFDRALTEYSRAHARFTAEEGSSFGEAR